jgi:hypothetical protein
MGNVAKKAVVGAKPTAAFLLSARRGLVSCARRRWRGRAHVRDGLAPGALSSSRAGVRCTLKGPMRAVRMLGSGGLVVLVCLSLGCSNSGGRSGSGGQPGSGGEPGSGGQPGSGGAGSGGAGLSGSGGTTDVCAGVAGGHPCNLFSHSTDSMPKCCGAASKCCPDGPEHEGCHPADQPCPKPCRSFFKWCGGTQMCRYSSTEGETDLSAQGCPGTGSPPSRSSCVDSCAAEATCGSECCGPGTICMNGCCAVSGAGDGGSSSADGSTAD